MEVPEHPTPAEAHELIAAREGFTVDEEWGCWLWEKTPSSFGPVLAFWEAARDELPVGMTIYHECPNGRRGCVRPAHMNVVPEGVAVPDPPVATAALRRFARQIRDERDARRFSRAQMARHLGVADSTLAGWEAGERMPAEDSYHQVSRRLGWHQKPGRFLVTAVHQRVIPAVSAGEAVRALWDQLEVEGEQLKTEVREVRRL